MQGTTDTGVCGTDHGRGGDDRYCNQCTEYVSEQMEYLNADEIELLAKIVWVEACGDPSEGQEAVVEVVFNRMCSPDYPDTLYGVLSQDDPVQFCSWKLKDTAKPTEKEYQSI